MIAIAIDGPSAAGKSTVAKRLAADLGFIYVDTGALYRAIGLHAVRNGADTTAESQVSPLLKDLRIDLTYAKDGQHIILCGEDVSSDIRSPEMGMAASNVSAHPSVRSFLLDRQRSLAQENNVVMDGRDIGTVVLPEAEVKIYLTAGAEERCRRRIKDHEARGERVDFDSLLRDIQQRDYNDMNRETAPLKQADDAVLLDSTDLTFEEVVDIIKGIIKKVS